MVLRALACVFLAVLSAAPLRADVIPAGHKPVEHLLVVSEALADGEVVAAAPTRGFHGVQAVIPGEPFTFSSKYGTRLYVLPAGAGIPTDLEALRAAAIASSDIPVSEVITVPFWEPVTSIVTTLRLARIPGGALSIQVIGEVRSGGFAAQGRLLAIAAVLVAVGLAGLVGIVWLVRRLTRAPQRP
jgi:hypothetical protein